MYSLKCTFLVVCSSGSSFGGVDLRENMLLVEGAIRSEFGYLLRRGEWGALVNVGTIKKAKSIQTNKMVTSVPVGECGRFSCRGGNWGKLRKKNYMSSKF